MSNQKRIPEYILGKVAKEIRHVKIDKINKEIHYQTCSSCVSFRKTVSPTYFIISSFFHARVIKAK